MQPPRKSSCEWMFLALVAILGVAVARSAPRQANGYLFPLAWKDLAGSFGFPEQEQPSPPESPEPRGLYAADLDEPDAQQDLQQELRQVLLLTSGLSPVQIGQRRRAGGQGEGRFLGPRGTTVVVITSGGSGAVNNSNTNNIVTNATAVPASTTTTGTRTSEFIRAPIGYPVQYPLQTQYFRRRQDEGSSSPAAQLSSPALSYPELFGWGDAALYGGGGGGDYAGLGVLPGGYGLPGVPLVPITVGNEVRYVPMSLRMFRQLASGPPLPLPPAPAVRESGDQEDGGFASVAAFVPELTAHEEEGPDEESEAETEPEPLVATGHSAPGFGILGQRLRARPPTRRRPLQSLAQNVRRVQYLRR
ncbi:LOW QUALITY PROTEIN: uncharacterized protein LOC108096995 [Drosophila ficusphila]|uniref:LOW QUALITY PROTEIN: uncharacterized protein LOC108096995 n=1 Tax=Drosophila ficusphila TaxID=30025 RepID=UPI001C8A738D|nr:LOW QUALITY PROTEIN: uncharacterized protein LOC108096995 [Drosophila ficusphila]